MRHWLEAWGRWLARRPWRIVLAWAVLAAIALPAARDLKAHLGQERTFDEPYESDQVQRMLVKDFRNPYAEPLLIALSLSGSVADPLVKPIVAELGEAARRVPGVAQVASPTDPHADARLRGQDSHSAFLLVGLERGASPNRALGSLRAALRPLAATLRARDPGSDLTVTGALAVSADVIEQVAQDSHRAEARVVLPALILLLAVFGSPIAAALPVVLGLLASLTASALLAVASRLITLNALALSTVSMLGLALGIDYALLIVSRFRERRKAGDPVAEAIATTLGTAGWTVWCSGGVVLVSLGVLVPFHIADPASVGLGGALVVGMAVALALTLLPALLVIMARGLDWPRQELKPLALPWAGWGRFLVRHRGWAAAIALAALLPLALPARDARIGMPEARDLPAHLESIRGITTLARGGRGAMSYPLLLVVKHEGEPILDPAGIRAMFALSRHLQHDPRVHAVLGPVDLRPGLGLVPYLMLYANPARALHLYPTIEQLFLSRDPHAALMQVVLKDDVTLAQGMQLVRELRRQPVAGLRVMVGGSAARNLDYQDRLLMGMPWALAAIFALSALILFAAFRSVLVAVKAIVLNMLSVAASLGATVWVFQQGHGASWLGMGQPLGALPVTIPLLVFCLTFGLSMDYELFMISRVREARSKAVSEGAAIVEGLTATGGVIAAAAALMVLVFASFAGAEIVLVKLLGFGLATAIALDATVIRLLLAPALLALAGRWNWWPGDRAH